MAESNADRPGAPWEQQEVAATAREAGRLDRRAVDARHSAAQRPLVEAVEGEAEGFELSEGGI